MNRLAALLLTGAMSAAAYVPLTIDGPQTHRTDYANIQFLVNQSIVAGLTNTAGTVWITADSSPMSAINGAIAAWNGVSTSAIHFLPVQSTSLSYNQKDGNDVIVFADDAYTESVTNGVLAFTPVVYYTDGSIFDTDIFFSPNYTFSTTGVAGTYDMQAVLTHELGHSLGANHTNILSATMFQTTVPQDTHAQALSADENALVSSLYPPAAGNGYGIISGVTTVAGAPLLGGVITALDPNTGITVGGFSSVTTGAFSFQVPPGNYYLYVEPAAGLTLYTSNPQTVVFTSFQSSFAGGNTQPTLTEVQAGATATVNLDAAAGLTPIRTPFAALGTAGATNDYHGSFVGGSLSIPSGQSVDYIFGNPLSSATLKETNLQVLGPATLRKGSLRLDPSVTLSDGTPVYRFTLDIPPVLTNTSASLVIRNGTDILTRSALFDLTRPQSVNAGSFLGGAVAPGEILSFFSSQLGPATAASNGGFGSNGTLPTSLGGITVSFDQTQAPLFYVSNNQINLQVPYEIANQASTLMTVFYNGTAVAKTTLSVAKSAPGIFVVTNADGSANGPGSPSPAGSVLVIYGTGAGVTSGLLRTGAPAPANSTIAASVTIGGSPVTPIYAGLTPGSVGLTQVNVAIPPGTPSGTAVPLQFSINGAATQTVNIAVQ